MKLSKEIICGIYKITSPSGKVYIGMSPNIYLRWSKYRYEKAKRQPKLNASFLKYGVDNHNFEIVEICDKEVLDFKEVHYISIFNSFNSPNGMNLTLGGRGSKGCRIKEKNKKIVGDANRGRVVSEEVRKRTSETLKRMYASGHPHPTRGKKQSPEVIANRAVKNTGKTHSDETKKTMSLKAMGNKKWEGRHHTEESKKRISEANKGKPKNPEFVKRMSENNKKLILNTQTGIFYFGLKEAALSKSISLSTLNIKLRYGNTDFIYA